MRAGSTVIPDGSSRVDLDGVDGWGHSGGDGDRAGEEGGCVEWLAGVVEGGLSDGVCLGPEVELDLWDVVSIGGFPPRKMGENLQCLQLGRSCCLARKSNHSGRP